MQRDKAIPAVEAAWALPDGVLWRLRQGELDEAGLTALIALLRSIEVGEADLLPRRLVSLLWYMPTFMEWQAERVAQAGGNVEVLWRAAITVRNELERILGVP